MAIAGLLSNRMIRQIQYRMGDVFMRQCERGHFYDDTRFASCNYCKDGTGLGYQAVAAFQTNPIPQFQNAPSQPLQAAPAPAHPGFKFCTNCGTKADASCRFCTGCGRPFPQMTQQPASDIGKTVAAVPASPTSDIGKTVAVRPMSVTPTSDIGKTVAVQPMSVSPTSDIGKTVAVQPMTASPTSDIGKTVAVQPMTVSPTSDIGKTVAVHPVTVAPEFETAKTEAVQPAPQAVPQTTEIGRNPTVRPEAVQPEQKTEEKPEPKPLGTQPVAFLVCITGDGYGDYYKVKAGKNIIAGGADADIRLDKDSTVSADCHFAVTYDPDGNKFTLSAGNGTTYINGNQAGEASDLKAYDRIKAGDSELLFVPVCSDSFRWDDKA